MKKVRITKEYRAPRFEKIDLTTQERVAACDTEFVRGPIVTAPTYTTETGLAKGCKMSTFWTASDS